MSFLHNKKDNPLGVHAKHEYAFITAAENGHLQMVKYLVTQGVNTSAFPEAILLAKVKDQDEVADYLSSYGVPSH